MELRRRVDLVKPFEISNSYVYWVSIWIQMMTVDYLTDLDSERYIFNDIELAAAASVRIYQLNALVTICNGGYIYWHQNGK